MKNTYTQNIEIQEEEKVEKVATTENGMSTNTSSLNDCVDLFFIIGSMRGKKKERLIEKFTKAFAHTSVYKKVEP